MGFWIIYILLQISIFGGLLSGVLVSVFFKKTFFVAPPHHKKASSKIMQKIASGLQLSFNMFW